MKKTFNILNLLFILLFAITVSTSVYAASTDVDDYDDIWGDYVSEEVSLTLQASTGMKVVIEHSFGNIDVRTGQNSQIKINGEKRVSGRTDEIEQGFLDQIELITETRGNVIYIRTEYPDINRYNNGRRNNIQSYSLSYTIEIPEKTTLDAENSFGNIDLLSISGDFNIRNMHGKISAEDLIGNTILQNKFGFLTASQITGDTAISNEHGSIECSDVTGELTIKGSFGSVEVADTRGDAEITNKHGAMRVADISGNADLRNEFGLVECADVSGKADISNSHSSVSVSDIRNDTKVANSFGKITAESIDGSFRANGQQAAVEATGIPGDVDIKTSFGAVTLANIGGNIEVINQHGNITVRDIISQSSGGEKRINLKTNFSPIRLSLPETLSAKVSASTSFGSITCDFPILMTLQGEINSRNNKDKINGTIGDGKDTIILENSQGSIHIDKE